MTHDENYAAIMAAWMNPGPQPAYHRAMQAEVHRTMPVLAAALERAALDVARRRPAHRPEIRPTTDDDMVKRAVDAHRETFNAWPVKRNLEDADNRRVAAMRAALNAALGTEEGEA